MYPIVHVCLFILYCMLIVKRFGSIYNIGHLYCQYYNWVVYCAAYTGIYKVMKKYSKQVSFKNFEECL